MLSSPGPPRPRRAGRLVDLVAAVILAAAVALTVQTDLGGPPPAALEEPERALALLVTRTLDAQAALAAGSPMEVRLHGLAVGDRAEELERAIAWYDELAEWSLDPGVPLRRAILLGEAGQAGSLSDVLADWAGRDPLLAASASVLEAAYLDGAPPRAEAVETTLQALEDGWFRDVLTLRLGRRLGEPAAAATAQAAIAARGATLVGRLRALTALEALLLAGGLLALALLRARGATVAAAPLPPAWTPGAGLRTLVRGGAAGVLVLAGLVAAGQRVDLDDPWVETLAHVLMFVPVVLVAWRRLLVPAGLGVVAAFGLRPRPGGGATAALATLALVAGGLVIDLAVALLEPRALAAHWTEGFDPALAWGAAPAVVAGLVGGVLVAPVLEELIFRGLLYGSLRAWCGAGPERGRAWLVPAVASGLVFALAHGYGAGGFASVLLSGILWAWAYERTRSLLPGILAHAVNNALVALAFLVLLRA